MTLFFRGGGRARRGSSFNHAKNMPLSLHSLLQDIDDELGNSSLIYKRHEDLVKATRAEFFRRVGNYEFRMHDLEVINNQARIDFEEAFLLHFLPYRINFKHEEMFYLKLNALLKENMPLFSRMWGEILDNIMNNQREQSSNFSNSNQYTTGHTEGQTHNQSKTHQEGTSLQDGTSTSKGNFGNLDTPQNQMPGGWNMAWATAIGQTEQDGTTHAEGTSTSDSDTTSDGTSAQQRESVTKTDSLGGSSGASRTEDVYNIYMQWVSSGQNMYRPIYQKCFESRLFISLLN